MTDLTTFILDRIAEDEAVAQEASAAHPRWSVVEAYGCIQIQGEDGTPITMDSEGLSDSVQDFAAAHIARHDPARVLAQCAALRGAIDAAWQDHLQIEGEWGQCRGQDELSAANDYPDVLRALASIWIDHEDYPQEDR